MVVIYWYLLINALAILIYGYDKYAAIKNKWRIPEARLLLLSLSGGWLGALIAQVIFHHKIRKTKFQLLFWLTACPHFGLLFLALH
ncbi:MAG: DUF1294 domain-containing protein [Parashewanella sp.]